MVIFAYLTIIFYFLAWIFLGIFIAFRKKKFKHKDLLISTTIILFIYFAYFWWQSAITHDPILEEFWPIITNGSFLAGIVAFVYIFSEGLKTKVQEAFKEIIGAPEMEYRTLPLKQAENEIEEYIKHKKEKVWLEDVINDLKIEPEIIIKVIKKLEKEGKIK
jgi:hypothetical protein